MSEKNFRKKRILGKTGLEVSRLGIAAAYGISERGVERAVEEYEINYLHWDRKKPGMKNAIVGLVKRRRDSIVIAMQSYDHTGFFLRKGVEKGLKLLGIDGVDILFLGWFNKMPGRRVLDVVNKLKEENKVRFLGVTGHNRAFHSEMARADESPFDVHQIRYNPAHRGAETEVFESLPQNRPGITTYTATRWGRLLKERNMPRGEKPLTAADCYRFVLSNPVVDLCLTGPRTEKELVEGLNALHLGPLSDEEMRRARKIGDFVHG